MGIRALCLWAQMPILPFDLDGYRTERGNSRTTRANSDIWIELHAERSFAEKVNAFLMAGADTFSSRAAASRRAAAERLHAESPVAATG